MLLVFPSVAQLSLAICSKRKELSLFSPYRRVLIANSCANHLLPRQRPAVIRHMPVFDSKEFTCASPHHCVLLATGNTDDATESQAHSMGKSELQLRVHLSRGQLSSLQLRRHKEPLVNGYLAARRETLPML